MGTRTRNDGGLMHALFEMYSFVVNVLAIAGVLAIEYSLLEGLYDSVAFLVRITR
jgi:hypothetical protein